MDSLAQRAIEEALIGNWKEAENLNKQILEEEAENKEALNRLARASLELGKTTKALACYRKVLKLDPYNSIAQKAVKRLELIDSSFKNGNGKKTQSLSLLATANLFIEEPGKTKTVSLIHLGDCGIINSLDAGEAVKLAPHAHRVSVETENGYYVGRLPDDLSYKIISLTRAGNKYSTVVKSVLPDNVRVFIRETERSQSLLNTPSFPVEKANHNILDHEEKATPTLGDEV